MAEGVELATAYVSLAVSAKGLGKDVKKQFSQVEQTADKTGKSAGKRMSGALGGALKAGAAGVAAAGIATLGAAMVKGFQRLNALDQATAKLRGLGNSAQDVDKIMANALASVKGTSFGLGEAATTAAGAVAAGIKPGSELEQVLKNVANTAAASGVSLEEMGAIFNRVATNGKASNQELQQLADRGIPIYGNLAEQLGVTNEEVFKLASQGKISFQQFSDAAKQASGTVADEMGKTVSGSISNFFASLGRIGAGLMGGVFDQLAPAIQGVTKAMGPLEAAAKSAGDGIGVFVSALAGTFRAVAEKVGPILATVAESLAPVVAALADQFGPILQEIGPQIAGVVKNLSPMSLVFQALEPILPRVVDLVGTLAESLGGVLAAVLPTIVSLLATMGEVFASTIVPILTELVSTLLPVFLSVWESIAPLLEVVASTILPAVASIFSEIVPVLGELVRALLPPLASLFAALAPVVAVVASVVGSLVAILVPVLVPVIKMIVKILGAVLIPVFKLVGWIIETVVVPIINVLVGVIEWLLDGIMWLAKDGGRFFGELWNKIVDANRKIIDTIKGLVASVVARFNVLKNRVEYTIRLFIAKIKQFFADLRDKVVSTALALRDRVVNGFISLRDRAVNTILTLRDRVVDRFNSLRDRAMRTINGFRDKIVGAFEKIKTGVTDIAGGIRDAVGKAFDQLKDKAKEPVRFVIETVLNNGLIKGANKVASVVGLGDNWIPTVPLPRGFASGGWTGPGSMFQPAGIVHADEFVINKASRGMFEKRFPGYLQHINDTGSLPGYARGGRVFQPVPGHANQHSRSQYPWASFAGDFPVSMGTPIKAWKDGIVAAVRRLTYSYGKHVRINHDDGTSSLYAHMSRILVDLGQRVAGGQTIGLVGSTGNSTGPHLHFETMGGPYTGGKSSGGKSLKDLFAGFTNPVSWLSDLIGGALGKDVPGGMLGDLAGKIPDLLAEGVKSKIKDVFSFDSGGWLEPGMVGFNGLKQPEAVFTKPQLAELARGGDTYYAYGHTAEDVAVALEKQRRRAAVLRPVMVG